VVAKDFVHLSALILAIINGLILFWRLKRDRPKLRVRPLHPDQYQWWFRLPPGEYQGQSTRKHGFLAYIEITNRGLRDVSFVSWGLRIKTRGGKKLELHEISIPEPRGTAGASENIKFYPVLGQKTPHFEGSTLVKSGASTLGMAYYIAEVYGSEDWDPPIAEDGKVQAKVGIEDAFDNKTSCKITFSEISLERAGEIVPGIARIG